MLSENGAKTEESEEYLGRRFFSTYYPDLQNYLIGNSPSDSDRLSA